MRTRIQIKILVTLLCVVFTAEVRAQLPNAWGLIDNSTNIGSFLNYFTNITSAQKIAATNSGWRYTMISRHPSDFPGSIETMSMIFGDGTRRFGVVWDLDASGYLTVTPLGSSTLTLTTNTVAAMSYHVHQLSFDPAIQLGTYRFDDNVILTWAGDPGTLQSNIVQWGASSSAGKGVMNFHKATFEVLSLGVIASYQAGTAGNPVNAPIPTTQGWTRGPGTVVVLEPRFSPDSAPLPLAVTTLPATALERNTAALNASINPGGQQTSWYFEYGTTTNYGSVTATNTVPAGNSSVTVTNTISGLDVGTLHHFRAIASNSIWMAKGQDQSFSTTTYYSLTPGVYSGSAAWGDYDNDGLLELLLMGFDGSTQIAQMWRYTGTGFTNINTGLPVILWGSVAWGDYDNDGRLDVLLTGYTPSATGISQVWRNTGTGFTNINAGLPGLSYSSGAWGDYDNDGRLDILLTGTSDGGNSGAISQVWRNTGSGFTNINAGLPGVYLSSAAWGDYDNDGRLDFLLTGYDGTNGLSQVWRNTGSGFTNINVGLPGVNSGSVAWGDYDHDGLLDLLLAGHDGINGLSQVWRNTGSGFTNINAGLPGIFNSSVGWGDYDNDGLLDILLSGNTGAAKISQVWRNTGTGFTNLNAGLPGVYYASAAWGDYDNDGRLDFVLVGYDDTNVLSQVWQNLQPNTNTIPTAPSGLSAVSTNFWVMLQWNPASDSQTPADGLSYNLRVGTTPGGSDVVGPQANASGFRRLPATGNAQPGTNAILLLTPGIHYWSVQAIDSVFAGSPFAVEGSFIIPFVFTLPATGLQLNSATLNALIHSNGLATSYYFEYGTTTNYGSVTATNTLPAGPVAVTVTNAISGLAAQTLYHFRAVASNSIGVVTGQDLSFLTLAEVTTLPATGMQPDAATLNAFLNLGGVETSYYFEYGTTTNYGSFSATNTIPTGSNVTVSTTISGLSRLTLYHFRAVASNNIGVVGGQDQSFSTPAYYSITPGNYFGATAWGDYDHDGRLDVLLSGYDGTDRITRILRNTGAGFTNINAGLPGVSSSSVAWGDYDNDGRLDLVLAGDDGTNELSQVWRNTGSGFTNLNAGLPGFSDGSVAWGDYDNDGRLDILLAGAGISEVWRNTGAGFSNLNAGLPGVYLGSVAWGDYDNDGWLDILLTGTIDGLSGLSQVWRNTGSGFTNINAGLPGVNFGSVAWGDYDHDGLLDLLLAGYDGTNGLLQVWRNTGSGFTNLNAGLPGIYIGSAAWGDYDNDGLLDILLTGYNHPVQISQVWRNTGSGFTNLNAGLPGVYRGSVAWGDYDNDGRLDFLLTGFDGTSGVLAQVWPILQPNTNTVPAAPSGLTALATSPSITLQWNAAGDSQTAAAGLTYNLRVGTTPGGSDIVSAQAETNGFRLLPALGNAQLGTNAFLNLQPGTYYWSVQAVDTAFAGGPFAPEASFVAPPPTLSILSASTNAIISWQPPYPGWILQESLSLAPVAWSNSPSGATNPIAVPAVVPTKFYRLFKP